MIRKWMVWALLIPIIVAGTPARADDELDQLAKDFNAAMQKCYEQFQGERSASQPTSMPTHPSVEFAPKFRVYAEKHAGTPDAIRAMIFIIGNPPSWNPAVTDFGQIDWALKTLTEQCAASPALGEHLQTIQYAFYQIGIVRIAPFFERVIKDNPEKEIRATAMHNLGFALDQGGFPPPSEDAMKVNRKRAEALYRQLVAEYPDTAAAGRAKGFLFEKENLQIGMRAPDFTGQDADGNDIKLSQFRGNVVVIDFWGYW